jgi:hypothetical protein
MYYHIKSSERDYKYVNSKKDSRYLFILYHLDVFIYRHFSKYIPRNCTLITGGGGYGTDFNRRKLARISRDMGFAHANISGMGSTWFVRISF